MATLSSTLSSTTASVKPSSASASSPTETASASTAAASTSWAGVHAPHLTERGILRRNMTLEVSRWGLVALTTLNIQHSPLQSTAPGKMQVLEDIG